MKPRVFIGSSSESLGIAYALQSNLSDVGEVTVWKQGIFQLSKSSLASLINGLNSSDFGIFVFTPDDIINIRNKGYQSARDNVIFELGLFIGRLGPERNFLVMPKNIEEFHLPTDLLGVTPAFFDADRRDGNMEAALGPAAFKIQKELEKFAHSKLSRAVRLEKLVVSSRWILIHNPEFRHAKKITFQLNGNVGEGRNQNEYSWRVRAEKLELINSEAHVYSRFEFNPQTNRFTHTNDPDTLSSRDQSIIAEGNIDTTKNLTFVG